MVKVLKRPNLNSGDNFLVSLTNLSNFWDIQSKDVRQDGAVTDIC